MNEPQYQSANQRGYQHAQAPHPLPARRSLPLLIDCDACEVRGVGCADCVVSVLLGGPPEDVSGGRADAIDPHAGPAEARVTLNDEERRAVEVLAAAGMVPPLRLVTGS